MSELTLAEWTAYIITFGLALGSWVQIVLMIKIIKLLQSEEE